jgi:hypothetical protein
MQRKIESFGVRNGEYGVSGTEQDFGANFEQENGANADVRACLIRRMRTMSLLGTLQKTRSEIDSGI